MAKRRKTGAGNVLGAPSTLRGDLLNIHDAFLNVSLQRSLMLRSSMDGVNTAEEFLMSDRGRFERTYVAFLAVLIEAWCSARTQAAREAIAKRVATQSIDETLEKARRSGAIDKMRSIRGYMFHRDQREYWDSGRVVVAELQWVHEEIFEAFSRAFLAFFNSTTATGSG